MDRISEIQARLAAINTEIDAATGDALTALETESRSLLEELNTLQGEVQARQALRQQIAAGAGTQMTAAPASAPSAEQRAAEEFRSTNRMTIEAEKLESDAGTLKYKAACSTASGKCSEAIITFVSAEADKVFSAIPETLPEYDRTADIAMDTDQLMSLMPHRFPFLLVDYIAKTEDTKVSAIKNVSSNEPFFSCGFDNLPEALLCEIGAQASCASVLARPENAGKLGFFMAIDKAVYYRRVYPGEQLRIESDLPAGSSKFGKGSGKIYSGNELVFEITLMFAIVDA